MYDNGKILLENYLMDDISLQEIVKFIHDQFSCLSWKT